MVDQSQLVNGARLWCTLPFDEDFHMGDEAPRYPWAGIVVCDGTHTPILCAPDDDGNPDQDENASVALMVSQREHTYLTKEDALHWFRMDADRHIARCEAVVRWLEQLCRDAAAELDRGAV